MQQKKITMKHRFEFALLSVFLFFIKMMPLRLMEWNRRVILFLFKKMDGRFFSRISKNLIIAYPDATDDERLALQKKIYRHFSLVTMQIMYLFVKKDLSKILKNTTVNNGESLNRVLEKKQGVILFTAHFGNWELIPHLITREFDRQVFSIARHMDNPLVERKLIKFRNRMGSEILYKEGSIRKTLRLLEDNQVVIYLIDQNTLPREGVFVDFFSKKASAVTSVSQLHLKKNIPLVPLFLHYEEDRIVLDIGEEIAYERSNDMEKDIQALTQQCTTIIENQIKKYPEQWFWFHNRWKTQPQRSVS